jgi:hypothetical protein
MTHLVVEVDQEQGGDDADDEEPGPVVEVVELLSWPLSCRTNEALSPTK